MCVQTSGRNVCARSTCVCVVAFGGGQKLVAERGYLLPYAVCAALWTPVVCVDGSACPVSTHTHTNQSLRREEGVQHGEQFVTVFFMCVCACSRGRARLSDNRKLKSISA